MRLLHRIGPGMRSGRQTRLDNKGRIVYNRHLQQKRGKDGMPI